MEGGYLGLKKDKSPYISPYMINPDYLQTNSNDQYIKMEGLELGDMRRQLAFNQIGLSAIGGATVGGMYGLVSGVRETKKANIRGVVRRTQLLNFIVKKGGSSAQSIGTMAVLYNIFGVGLTFARQTDDELNTLAAAGATGLLYKSSGGLYKSMRGGVIGLALAATYCFIMRKDRVKQMIGMD